MPKAENTREDWLTVQLRGTQNVTAGTFEDWFTGFLNYQIEHHLFPNMPRHSYPMVKPRIQALCRKHGIPYNETTLWGSFSGIVDKLGEVADKYTAALSAK
jgi:fatty acid desaturase